MTKNNNSNVGSTKGNIASAPKTHSIGDKYQDSIPTSVKVPPPPKTKK